MQITVEPCYYRLKGNKNSSKSWEVGIDDRKWLTGKSKRTGWVQNTENSQ